MAQLHPDLFAGALVLSAYDDTKLPDNLLNVPVRFSNGGADPAANQAMLAATVRALDALGYVDYRSRTATTHQHPDPVGVLNSCVIRELTSKPTVRDPARVVYGLDPANEISDEASGLRVLHQSAYWVSGIVMRAGASPRVPVLPPAQRNLIPHSAVVGLVDVTSLARPVRSTVGTAVEGLHSNLQQGADYCGPNPAAQTRDTWREHGMTQRPGRTAPVRNAVVLHTSELSAVALDTARMALTLNAPLQLEASTDGPLRLTLQGNWPHERYDVTVSGRPLIRVKPSGLALVVPLPSAVTGTIAIRAAS
jgi:hypothetical protein